MSNTLQHQQHQQQQQQQQQHDEQQPQPQPQPRQLQPGFDLVFARRFIVLMRTVLFHDVTTVSVFSLFLSLSLLGEVVYYNVGLVPSRFMEVLTARHRDGFITLLWQASLIVLLAALMKSLHSFMASMLYVTWRGCLTRHLHVIYMQNLMFLHTKRDNPDQRITQDVERLCLTCSTLLAKVGIVPLTLVYYTWQCWSMMGAAGTSFIYASFVLSAIINKIIMSPMVRLVYQQEKLEGDFRRAHLQVSSESEQIAFCRGQSTERKRLDGLLGRLLTMQRRLLIRESLILAFSNNTFDYLGSILSYLVIAIPIFMTDKYDDLSPELLAGLVSRSAFVAMYLVFCFTQITDMSIQFTDLAGYTARIVQLFEDAKESDSPHDDELYTVSDNNDGINECLSDSVHVESLSIDAPDGRSLVRQLTLHVSRGQHTLIVGASGVGKTSFLRVLARLWPAVEGWTSLPNNIMFVPQRPYLAVEASLAEHITYPMLPPSNCDEELYALLEIVGFDGRDLMLHHCPAAPLSPGEQQRLAFARLLYHRPHFAALDEASNALDISSEQEVMVACQRANITLISIAHRDSLRSLHKVILELHGDNTWTTHFGH